MPTHEHVEVKGCVREGGNVVWLPFGFFRFALRQVMADKFTQTYFTEHALQLVLGDVKTHVRRHDRTRHAKSFLVGVA